jgi:hypothetical protein
VSRWLVWYNERRLHSAIDYMPPVEYEKALTTHYSKQPERPAGWRTFDEATTERLAIWITSWRRRSSPSARVFQRSPRKLSGKASFSFVRGRTGDSHDTLSVVAEIGQRGGGGTR